MDIVQMIPRSFPEDVMPRVITHNFRNSSRDKALKVIILMHLSPNPDVEEGCVISDLKEIIYGPHHRVAYLLGKLEEIELIEKRGIAEVLPGRPNIYVLTDMAKEVFGDFESILSRGNLYDSAVAETSTQPEHLLKYAHTFYSPYSKKQVSINDIMSVMARKNDALYRSRMIAGMLGMLGLGEEFDTEIISPVVFRDWLKDQAEYFETYAKLLFQVIDSPYLKDSNPGNEARQEIYTPVDRHGNVEVLNRELGLTAEQLMKAIKTFLQDPDIANILGETKMMFASALYDNVANKLDTGD